MEIDGGGEGNAYQGIAGTDARTCAAWIRINNLGSSDSDYLTIVSWGNNNSSGERWQFMLRDHDTDSDYQLRIATMGGYVYGDTNLNDGDNLELKAIRKNGTTIETVVINH